MYVSENVFFFNFNHTDHDLIHLHWTRTLQVFRQKEINCFFMNYSPNIFLGRLLLIHFQRKSVSYSLSKEITLLKSIWTNQGTISYLGLRPSNALRKITAVNINPCGVFSSSRPKGIMKAMEENQAERQCCTGQ